MGSTHVIYHRADFDGLLSAAVCLHFIPDAILHGWDHGDIPVAWDSEPDDRVFVVDLPPTAVVDYASKGIVWIDHHKSSIDQFESFGFSGLRIDGVAACRLCWAWCLEKDSGKSEAAFTLPLKHEFVERAASEPLVLTLAGEYDVWDLHDERALWLQHGLAMFSHDPTRLTELLDQDEHPDCLSTCGDAITDDLVRDGENVEGFLQAENAKILAERSYVRTWEGLRWLVLNTAKGNSRSFPGTADRGDIDALMMWRYDGEKIIVSLYHKQGREDLDLSEIAVKHGGGGHRGACGFTAAMYAGLEVVAGI